MAEVAVVEAEAGNRRCLDTAALERMDMKLAHLSDLHLGRHLNQYSLLEDQRYILKQIAAIIREQGTEAVLISGDVYDRPVPSGEAVMLLDDFLAGLAADKLPVCIISGNHDSPERIAFASRLIAPSGVFLSPVYHGGVEPVRLRDSYGPVNIYMLPYVKPIHVRHFYPDEEIRSYTDAIRCAVHHMNVDRRERNILLAHQFVTGASRSDSEEISVGGLDNVDSDVFDEFDYVALGHLHRMQSVGDGRIRYCGTPLQYSFSEAGDHKAVTMVNLGDKGTLSVDSVPLVPLRELIELEGKFDEVTSASFYKKVDQEAYIHMTLTDDQEVLDAFSRLRRIYPNLMQMEYKKRSCQMDREFLETEKTPSLAPSELFAQFYQKMNQQPLSEAQEEYLQKKIEKIWQEM